MQISACPVCRRQYDVTGLGDGERISCHCGEAITVRHRTPLPPRPVRCDSCGAALPANSLVCGFCKSEVVIEERRLDSICPECFGRMHSGASFCSNCGLKLDIQPLQPLPEKDKCPRCAGTLRLRELGSTDVVECRGCGGLWFGIELFKRVIDDKERRDRMLQAIAKTQRSSTRTEFRYLLCPDCEQPMMPRNFEFRSGILLDICSKHGVWMDHGELEAVIDWIRAHGVLRPGGNVIPAPKATAPDEFAAPGRVSFPVESGNRPTSLWWNVIDLLSALFSNSFFP